ncbi:MAG: hypothetical protein HY581_12835 [Nitrospirae bacterium]|nr:hypothetical protein [Nitrospirota bacterium]
MTWGILTAWGIFIACFTLFGMLVLLIADARMPDIPLAASSEQVLKESAGDEEKMRKAA